MLAPIDDDDLDMIKLVNTPRFIAMLNRSIASARRGIGVPHDEAWKRIRAKAAARKRVTSSKGSRRR